jgi:glycosyltransferase involved in cell wall biosynthesis
VRVAVYTDYAYHRTEDGVHAERAFALFVARLADHLERVVVVGRLDPSGSKARYPLGDRVGFVPLPFYVSLTHVPAALRASWGSLRTFWRVLGDVDGAWLLGPHPLAIAFALLARARRRRVVLGVRQDQPAYVRSRHPGRLDLRAAAWLLERSFRALARRLPVVVVGPEVARAYRHARSRLEIVVSLVDEDEILPVDEALARSYDGDLTVLSVGRLDAEKNPLLLADVLALLNAGERRWRLIVCGEGAMEGEVAARIAELGLADRVELRGYVPLQDGLMDTYRRSHALLHVSWTEGLPQVILEAFAAGLPVVASDVGGIAGAVGPAAIMVPPGEARAAAAALRGLAADPELRRSLIEAGREFVRAHTFAAEVRGVARFLQVSRDDLR